MQRGHMRFEPNINLEMDLEDGRTICTPIVEVKNLNSFRAVRGAIEHEYDRQEIAWREDGRVMGPGAKATRGWDDEKLVTVLQREKEDAHDYRYFPDPDLVPVVVDDAWLETVRSRLTELPAAKRERYIETLGLRPADADALLEEPDTASYFEQVAMESASAGEYPAVSKLILNQVAKRSNEAGLPPSRLGTSPAQLAGVLELRRSNELGAQSIDPLLTLLETSDGTAREVAEQAGLLVVLDDSQLEAWCASAIEANEQAADDVRGGKVAALGRLTGHVMKSARGSADAKAVQAKLLEMLQG